MDKKNFKEIRMDFNEEPESAPDLLAAERVMNNIMDSVGVERPSESFERVFDRVKKRRRISNFLTIMEIVLVIIIILSSFALFLRDYVSHVTVMSSTTLTEPASPPHSESVSYRDGALEIHLVQGSNPLDYTSASASRMSDGAGVGVVCDEDAGVVYIPCPRETEDYHLTICDTQGIPYTFVLHIITSA